MHYFGKNFLNRQALRDPPSDSICYSMSRKCARSNSYWTFFDWCTAW